MTTTDFDAAFDAFLTGAQEIIDAANLEHDAKLISSITDDSYIRVEFTSENISNYTWCFVNRQTGEVLACKAYELQGKLDCGNVFDKNNGLGANIEWQGPH